MMNFLLVAIGGGVGACLRYGVGLAVGNGAQATFAVNVLGSLVLGVLMGWLSIRNLTGESALYLLIGVGLLGAFTTFSAFSRETVHFFMSGDPMRGTLYAMANMTGAIAAFAVGLFVIRRAIS